MYTLLYTGEAYWAMYTLLYTLWYTRVVFPVIHPVVYPGGKPLRRLTSQGKTGLKPLKTVDIPGLFSLFLTVIPGFEQKVRFKALRALVLKRRLR